MQPMRDEEVEARNGLLILQNLGAAVDLQIQATMDEPLPAEMGLLLVRLALAEVLKDAEGGDAHEDEPQSAALEWARALLQLSVQRDACLQKSSRSPPLAAG